jgi:membrane-anchored protein YejM (alkaline phosphatase superfamily)
MRALSRRERWLVVGQFWMLGLALLVLLCGEYCRGLDAGTGRGWLYLHASRVASAATLSLVPGLLGLCCATFVSRRGWNAFVAGFSWSLSLLAVYIDTRIYGIFRYHFNGLVWNVLTTPGADEAVHLSSAEIALVLGGFAALGPALGFVFAWMWRRRALRPADQRTRLFARPRLVWGALLVPLMIAVAGAHAWADLYRDPRVMAFESVFPVYPKLKVKRFATRYLGVKLDERPSVDIPSSGILLDYPKAPLALSPHGPRPNIVLVVIDSLRAEMLNAEAMPRVHELARDSRVFEDHLSGGNATRFGIFSLIYGLHGSYWDAILAEHRSPVLVDALVEAGYDMRVLTSASMDFPQFRSTAFVRVESSVEDRLPAEQPGGRDDGVASRFDAWLGERADAARPFFAFLVLDAPHQTYSFPADCAVFRPYMETIEYTRVDAGASEQTRLELFNRYRNAVHYSDRITGRIIDALRAHAEFDDTLFVVTGDHGEEFFEHGVWGHTSNFTRTQTHVPFVLHGPGVAPGVETRATSHIDVPATLLEWLGADPARRADWTLGANLLDPPAGRSRVISSWDVLGLHTPDGILSVPMSGAKGSGITLYTQDWKVVYDDAAILKRYRPQLLQLALECRRFRR